MFFKRLLKFVLFLVLAVVLIVVGYFAYVLIQYDRIDDKVSLDVLDNDKAIDDAVTIGETYTIVTQNIGFGAYLQDFTFFMDGGTESWGRSKEEVIWAVNEAGDKVKSLNPDFALIQEVDFNSTRSYHINEKDLLDEKFSDYASVAAINYHSAFLMYPFNKPHGASNSEIVTYSKYDITSSLRRSLPISTSLSKLLDLDRCYSITRIPTSNGKELVLFNVHLSAYGSNDEIRTGQMTMLFSDMQAEYEKGNYCVCGGDFNHDFTGDSTQKLNGGSSVSFGWAMPFPIDILNEYDGLMRATSYKDDEVLPTCRNCDVPYEKGNFTIIVDGFLVSKNVEVVYLENIQFQLKDYLYY